MRSWGLGEVSWGEGVQSLLIVVGLQTAQESVPRGGGFLLMCVKNFCDYKDDFSPKNRGFKIGIESGVESKLMMNPTCCILFKN